MPSWLITGSSRGIGLNIVQTLLKTESNFVVATARNPDIPAFKELADRYPKDRLEIVQLDVSDSASVEKAAAAVTPRLPNGLDYLVNNAGVHLQPLVKFEDLDLELFQQEISFNTVVPVRVTRAFLPLIKTSQEKKVIFITSILGSTQVSYHMIDQSNAYSVGKAALNMVARKWGASLKGEGVSTAAIHPGWVMTDIGAPITEWMAKYAPEMPAIDIETSSASVIKVAQDLNLEKTALYWNYDGTNLPW